MHKIFSLSPVLVVNRVSYVFPPNFISRLSTPFPALALLGLVFVFSRSLVYIPTASISLSSWFVSISSGCSMSSSTIIFSGPSFSMVTSSRSFWSWFLMMLLLGSFSLSDGCSSSYFSSSRIYSSSPFSVMSSYWSSSCVEDISLLFALCIVVFVCDWDTWAPLKNWIPLGHLWLLVLRVQIVYYGYDLIIYW